MSYKISGTLNDSARILILKESDWSIESNTEEPVGDYEIESLVSGTKTVVAINNSGEVLGVGEVSPTFSLSAGNTGLFAGGQGYLNTIDYITISTTGDASDFGDLSAGKYGIGSTSNGTNDRGVFGGGYTGTASNIIDYVTITSIGDTSDFGDLITARFYMGATSNNTNNRGVFGGGFDEYSDYKTIDYITISSKGNAQDFGDLTLGRRSLTATSNSTNNRGVFGGGANPSNIIDYITISSAGDATDFGDLTVSKEGVAATSNGTNNRGVFGGGGYHSGGWVYLNTIDYITITSTGNASDFGDLSSVRGFLAATSNGTNNRGVFGGGTNGTDLNVIDYITISSTGDASDFGDLTIVRNRLSATSNA